MNPKVVERLPNERDLDESNYGDIYLLDTKYGHIPYMLIQYNYPQYVGDFTIPEKVFKRWLLLATPISGALSLGSTLEIHQSLVGKSGTDSKLRSPKGFCKNCGVEIEGCED